MSGSNKENNLFEYALRLGDNALINGQRLSEWCGHGPFLEEDVGVANTALDLIGRARMLLTYAGELEGKGRDEDALAYLRDERDWRNHLIMELPVRDFAFTTTRQFLVDTYNFYLYTELQGSKDERLSAIAQKAVKESTYHLRHTSEWMLRLGDGTEESHNRMQFALDELWPYTSELFEKDQVDEEMISKGIGPDHEILKKSWDEKVSHVLKEATLSIPATERKQSGGRSGLHTEHMGYLLAEMQYVQRAYPGMEW